MKRIKFGEPPRGGPVDTPSGISQWCGHDWEIEAGPAVVTTLLGSPHRVSNCLLPDGTRGDAQVSPDHRGAQILEGGPIIWKRELENGAWIFGLLEITADGAVFSDRPDLARPRMGALEGLEADLVEDQEIREAVADRDFSIRLYAALCNVTWEKNGESWDYSWRYAGRIVADLRGLNESYVDFYCQGQEGVVADDVAAHLARLGWSPKEE